MKVITHPRPAPRGEMARKIRHMQAATGLSDETCRTHLRDGTTPKQRLIATAWRAALRGAMRKGAA